MVSAQNIPDNDTLFDDLKSQSDYSTSMHNIKEAHTRSLLQAGDGR